MRVFGIDPGSHFCGWGVVEENGRGGLRHVESGVIRLGAKEPLEQRLVTLFERLTEFLKQQQPSIVAVEDVFHHHNARAALVLGHARGVALLAAARAGVTVRAFSPATIKQSVTGSGRAEKAQVGRMVSMLLGVRDFERADVSDALAAAICGALRPAELPQILRSVR